MVTTTFLEHADTLELVALDGILLCSKDTALVQTRLSQHTACSKFNDDDNHNNFPLKFQPVLWQSDHKYRYYLVFDDL